MILISRNFQVRGRKTYSLEYLLIVAVDLNQIKVKYSEHTAAAILALFN